MIAAFKWKGLVAVNPRDDVELATERGLDYIFAAQYLNGGCQYPIEKFDLPGGGAIIESSGIVTGAGNAETSAN